MSERLSTSGPGWFWTQDEWAEWSNELALLIPEDDVSRYANPEGAQESIVHDVLAAYVAERADQAVDLIDLQIVAGVDLATHYYRTRRPGRGAYELARLAMRVNRLLDPQQGESHAV